MDRIVEGLEDVKTRPRRFMAKDVPPFSNFLRGFVIACQLFDTDLFHRYEDIFREVCAERGWEYMLEPIWAQMSEAGLNDDEVTQETLTLYIEVMCRLGTTPSQEA
jgi:hypothetical protein